ncbi:MAG: exodeoxyribonuclease VII large subunit [Bacteroidales bacterium]
MDDKLSLTELQLVIRDSIYAGLPGLYWIVAEIAEYKENYSGHCYLELVEKHPDDLNIRARMKGIIWATRARTVKSLFERVTGEKLHADLKILVRAKVEYHEIYGLSLIINDIDPAYTMGEMALRKQQIIRRLEEEGVISMNRDLELTPVPKRIAIISSKNAAGYSDFMKHLHGNKHGYSFSTVLFDTVMQGPETEQSILDSFEQLTGNINFFDTVVIIRGGGSQADLSWFDNYRIAYFVTQLPIPVITGIGHEKDLSVTDIVAWKAEKTPTAAADLLINRMLETEEYISNLANDLSGLTMLVITTEKERLASNMMRLLPVTRMRISKEKELLGSKMIGLANSGKDYLLRKTGLPSSLQARLKAASARLVSSANFEIKTLNNRVRSASNYELDKNKRLIISVSGRLEILDPVNVLRRGFTITSSGGRILRSLEQTGDLDTIETTFHDGMIRSKVIKE